MLRATSLLLLAALCCSAGTGLSQKDLEKTVATWQRRLNLGEWKVTAAFADDDPIPDDAVGFSHVNPDEQTFRLWVLSARGYRQRGLTVAGKVRDDQIDTVVHEFVHLLFHRVAEMVIAHSYGTGDVASDFEEVMVAQLTHLLLTVPAGR